MARSARNGGSSAVQAPPRPAVGVWHTRPIRDVCAALETSPDGLTDAEARRRLERHGPNEVEAERETPWWKVLLHQVQDPLIYILLAAAAVKLILRAYTDMGVILAVVAVNTIIGFVQELRARAAIRGLARLSAPVAHAVRAGRPKEVPGRDLVPGDVVLLASGDRVPADVRLVEARDLEVDESALTGESAPVSKRIAPLASETLVPGDQVNMGFAGTVVTRGRARGVVVRTGASTELGRIAHQMREVGLTMTPLQAALGRLAKWIGVAVLGLGALVVAIGLLRGLEAGEILIAAVAMAVATVPEGLPVVVTVTLALGVRRMAARRAIIRSLPAVETLGSTTVIGSDKTGTLTRNEMTVRALWRPGRRYAVTGAGYAAEGEVRLEDRPVRGDDDPGLRRLLAAGALASEADPRALETDPPAGDPTELALLAVAPKAGPAAPALREAHRLVDLLPFEPERKFMASLDDGPDGRWLRVKGAPEVVLARCRAQLGPGGQEEPLDAAAARQAAAALAAEGLRVLAMAERRHDGDRADEEAASGLVLLGLHGMEDPVRPEAVEAVAAAQRAGVRVLMITGDHVDTARAIGARLGLGGEALEGHALQALSDEELDARLRDVNVFARVAPEHKLRVVQRLKEQRQIVAVTGDGVNDAPALRAAHLGVAMGKSGTDVAREASDMVLADDNFATITSAIEQGRVVFANIRKVTFFLLSTGAAMPMTLVVALLAGWPLPFVAAQILWINFVTKALQDVALAFEPGEPGLLDRRPRPPTEGVVTRPMLARMLVVGVILAAGTLAAFWWTLRATDDLVLARTVALTQMVVFQFWHVLNCRSLERSILQVPPLSNRFLFVSVVAALLAHLAALHVGWFQGVFQTVPLSAWQWAVIVAVGTLVILGGELDKWWSRRRGRALT
ncbi:MAG: HAD-IC family P-type ATPase [Planctomycetes bacterium]|nr:HAD-IC family P-type ATPase [Planctomycetota bacterium]